MDDDESDGAGGSGGGAAPGGADTSQAATSTRNSDAAESATSTGAARGPSTEEVFSARATGRWLLQFAVEGADGTAYVDDYDTFDGSRNTMSLYVEVFGDEARSFLLLTYEASFTYQVLDRSPTITDGFDIDIQNVEASMTAHVDPALFAGFGLDDGELVLDQPVDVSRSACGAPSFRDGSCLEQDIYQVAEGAEEMFPAAADGGIGA